MGVLKDSASHFVVLSFNEACPYRGFICYEAGVDADGDN